MWPVFRGISRRADVSDDLPFQNLFPFAQSFSVSLQVRVVIAVLLGWIELVDRRAAGLALEKPGDRAVFHGFHGRVSRRQNIDRFVSARTTTTLLERAHELIRVYAFHWHLEIPSRE